MPKLVDGLKGTAIAGLLAIIVTSAYAAPYERVFGSGNTSCMFWLSERKAGRGFSYDQWILGFISGNDRFRPDFSTDPEGNVALAWVANYCKIKPLDQLVQAAQAFLLASPERRHVP